jgi:hypothetical protein
MRSNASVPKALAATTFVLVIWMNVSRYRARMLPPVQIHLAIHQLHQTLTPVYALQAGPRSIAKPTWMSATATHARTVAYVATALLTFPSVNMYATAEILVGQGTTAILMQTIVPPSLVRTVLFVQTTIPRRQLLLTMRVLV